MPGHYVHHIDPIIATIGGVHLWWYGLSYSLGFLNAHFFLRRNRDRLGLSLADVYELSVLLALGVLAGGRALVVFRHEWSFYRDHLALVPAVWLGGLATHGLIIGGFAGVTIFCAVRKRPFRPIFDALAIPAAFILGCGRIGNFIDGQIVGSLTTLPWGVQFPEAEGIPASRRSLRRSQEPSHHPDTLDRCSAAVCRKDASPACSSSFTRGCGSRSTCCGTTPSRSCSCRPARPSTS